MKGTVEVQYLQSVATGLLKPKIPVIPYNPASRQKPSRSLDVTSAWSGIEDILADIITRFEVPTERCLEFGVEFGFSTVALSSYFDSVIGVDTFCGDIHTINDQDIYEETKSRLAPYSNIQLVRSDFADFILQDHGSFGLIHVDIIHTFAATYACGLWSAQNSKVTLFHDTQSFPQVKQAVKEIARATGKTFHNYPGSYGLGILV